MRINNSFLTILISIFIFFLPHLTLKGNKLKISDDTISQTARTERIALVGGVSLGAFIYGHVALSNLWWKGNPVPFHINTDDDYKYALNADKFGHFFFPYFGTDLYRGLFVWCGINDTTSLWLGAGALMTYQTYIEIRDGFSEQYGFSWGDFTANTIGTGMQVLRFYSPFLRKFHFKMSFYPSEKFKAGAYNAIIDDYESAFHWLSFDLHSVLPENLQPYFPAFISPAIGHSVANLDQKGGGNHVWYLALDWNLDAMHTGIDFLDPFLHYLNYYHLPAPAVMIYPDVVWYGLKF